MGQLKTITEAHLLYISVKHLSTFDLIKNELIETNEEIFRQNIINHPEIPVYMLVDMVDEELKMDTMPYVFGRDRKQLLERKLLTGFNNTAFRYGLVQERRTDGRKDLNILMAGLPTQDNLLPWIKFFQKHNVLLIGLYSVSLLMQNLYDKLKIKTQSVLLITHQEHTGIRYSFFQNHFLKYSRSNSGLTPEAPLYATFTLNELRRTRAFLDNLKLTTPKDTLDIYVIGKSELLEPMREKNTDEKHIIHLLSIDDVLTSNINHFLPDFYTDVLIIQLLLTQKPHNHYASSKDIRYHTEYRLNGKIKIASYFFVVIGLIWSIINGLNAHIEEQSIQVLEQEVSRYQSLYRDLMKGMPELPSNVINIQYAVDRTEYIEKISHHPNDSAYRLSQVLDRHKKIKLDKLEWFFSDHQLPEESELNASAPDILQNQVMNNPELQSWETLLIKGEVISYMGNYRYATTLLEQFENDLELSLKVKHLKILKHPINTQSSNQLRGDLAESNVSDEPAKFALKLYLNFVKKRP